MDESSIISKFDKLVNSGTVMYNDQQEIIEHIDGELKFRFVLTSALAKKPQVGDSAAQPEPTNNHQQQRQDGSDINTAGFEIASVGSTHFLVAPKFCFSRPHLMVLTRDGYKRQFEPLHESDFKAAWTVLNTLGEDHVLFYNCGQDGGCSRLHKHMQVMPKPETSFASFLDNEDIKEPNVPFRWFYNRFTADQFTPAGLTSIYETLLSRSTEVGLGLAENADTAPAGAACPHNMILTNSWMILIPRRKGAINKEAGANAIGMLGVIAVATQDEIDKWLRRGLTDSLRELGISQDGSRSKSDSIP